MSDFPIINGQMVSWAELTPSIEIHDGESIQTKDFAAIDYSDSLEGTKVPGVGPKHVGDTVGVYNAEGSITLYRAAAQRFMEALAAANSRGAAGLTKFDLVVSYAPLTGSGEVITDKLIGCRIASRQVTTAPSADAITVVLPLMVSEVILGGVRMV